jgi:hypothetical protein
VDELIDNRIDFLYGIAGLSFTLLRMTDFVVTLIPHFDNLLSLHVRKLAAALFPHWNVVLFRLTES